MTPAKLAELRAHIGVNVLRLESLTASQLQRAADWLRKQTERETDND